MKLRDLCSIELPDDKDLTEEILIKSGAIQMLPDIVRRHVGERFFCLSDPHTWAAASAEMDLAQEFGEAMLHQQLSEHPHGDIAYLDQLLTSEEEVDGFVAVGSGTICDMVKYLAAKTGKPCVVLGTAASMNGYASGIAALMDSNLKITVPAIPPRAIVLDTRILCQAPMEMSKAGFADLISRSVSMTDWWMSDRLEGGGYDDLPARIVDPAIQNAAENVPELPMRTVGAFESLAKALVLSGVSMAVAGSSAPASGGEHLISHLWDMQALAEGRPLRLHGAQVGVATCLSAALYEKLLAIETPDFISPPDWETEEERIRKEHGPLAEVVLPQAKSKWDRAESRLVALRAQWPSIREELLSREAVRLARIRELLDLAEAPDTLARLDIYREDAARTLRLARDIRERYTVLDLAFELGYFPGGIDEVIETSGV